MAKIGKNILIVAEGIFFDTELLHRPDFLDKLKIELEHEGFPLHIVGDNDVSKSDIAKSDIIILLAEDDYTDRERTSRTVKNLGKEKPIFVISNNAGYESAVRALEAGADDFMTTAYHRPILAARINSHLARVAIEREHGAKNPPLAGRFAAKAKTPKKKIAASVPRKRNPARTSTL